MKHLSVTIQQGRQTEKVEFSIFLFLWRNHGETGMRGRSRNLFSHLDIILGDSCYCNSAVFSSICSESCASKFQRVISMNKGSHQNKNCRKNGKGIIRWGGSEKILNIHHLQMMKKHVRSLRVTLLSLNPMSDGGGWLHQLFGKWAPAVWALIFVTQKPNDNFSLAFLWTFMPKKILRFS